MLWLKQNKVRGIMLHCFVNLITQNANYFNNSMTMDSVNSITACAQIFIIYIQQMNKYSYAKKIKFNGVIMAGNKINKWIYVQNECVINGISWASFALVPRYEKLLLNSPNSPWRYHAEMQKVQNYTLWLVQNGWTFRTYAQMHPFSPTFSFSNFLAHFYIQFCDHTFSIYSPRTSFFIVHLQSTLL